LFSFGFDDLKFYDSRMMGLPFFKDLRSATRPDAAATWLGKMFWVAVAMITLAIAIGPDLLSLPKPEGAIVLDRGTDLTGPGNAGAVTMPHAIYARFGDSPPSVRYQFQFDLPAASQDALYVFIPSFNRHILLSINGSTFFDSDAQTIWAGAFISASSLIRFPSAVLFTGPNVLTMEVFDVGLLAVPVYLSELYVGTAAELS
jgi:hypothetical protein